LNSPSDHGDFTSASAVPNVSEPYRVFRAILPPIPPILVGSERAGNEG